MEIVEEIVHDAQRGMAKTRSRNFSLKPGVGAGVGLGSSLKEQDFQPKSRSRGTEEFQPKPAA